MQPPLTPRERVLKALAFEEADIVPYHLMIDDDVRFRLAAYLDDPDFDQRIINHLPFYRLETKLEWTSADTYVDHFGSAWRAGSTPQLDRPALREPDLKGFTFPNLLEEDYFRGVNDFLSEHDQYYTLCGIAHGFFDRGWALRGMEAFLTDFITHPAFVQELFETLTDIYLNLIDHIATYSFDGIRFGDDWGYQRGVLIGVERWRKFVKPGLKKIFTRAREHGLTVMVHSDGDISRLVPDLIEIGVQILNPLQPEAMNVLEIKRVYGKELCFNGGISNQYTLPQGSPQDVRREVTACQRILGNRGGYVAGPSKSIMSDVPDANAVALIDALVNQSMVRGWEEDKIQSESYEALWRVYAEYHPGCKYSELSVRE